MKHERKKCVFCDSPEGAPVCVSCAMAAELAGLVSRERLERLREAVLLELSSVGDAVGLHVGDAAPRSDMEEAIERAREAMRAAFAELIED